MPLRLVEITLPNTDKKSIKALTDDESVITYWQEESSETGLLLKILLSAEQTEKTLDLLEDKFGGIEGFRVVMLPVEATIPRIEQNSTNQEDVDETQSGEETKPETDRISREELYTDIVDSIKLSNTFLALVALSSIVAAVGLLRDNVAVVIGAMVIAPLLGPNVALALATTLGDSELGRSALKANLSGIAIGLLLSIVIGFTFGVDLNNSAISTRTQVGFSDIVLALASGSAGVLAFTAGISATLIGVMVAVALLPPLVAFGLLLGAGYFPEAFGAFSLLITNLICVNLSGVTTFLIQGIRPRRWWEADKAERATRLAIALWSILLIILITVIIISQRNPL